MKKRVLVVPAGTEIAHEVYESLKYSKHWHVIGANSVKDHSEVTFREVHTGIPFASERGFSDAVQALVDNLKIDFVIPTHDDVIYELSSTLKRAVFVGPDPTLAQILRFKSKTIDALKNVVPTPLEITDPDSFPIFAKPNRGQGSRGARVISNEADYRSAQLLGEDLICQEHLPGEEVTVDCFSSEQYQVIYCVARKRERVLAGIATRMSRVDDAELSEYAEAISNALKMTGAWFFQMKRDRTGEFKLLEVANRLAGSSGFQRNLGVNLIDAWLHQLNGSRIAIQAPAIPSPIYERALYGRMKVDFIVSSIYVDFDDTISLDGGDRVHHHLIGLLFAFKIQKKIPVILITRHAKEISTSLERLGLGSLFSEVIHLKEGEPKSKYITGRNVVFIDDSFQERYEVGQNHGVICIPPESINLLEAML